MTKIKVTLKDKTQFEYESQFYWSCIDKLNDVREDFIELGDYIFKKDEISIIEKINIPDDKESE